MITFLPLWTLEFWDSLLFSSALLIQALRAILHPFAWNGTKGFSSATNGISLDYSGCCIISPAFYLELSWVWTCSLVHTESQHCQVVQHIRARKKKEREKESKQILSTLVCLHSMDSGAISSILHNSGRLIVLGDADKVQKKNTKVYLVRSNISARDNPWPLWSKGLWLRNVMRDVKRRRTGARCIHSRGWGGGGGGRGCCVSAVSLWEHHSKTHENNYFLSNVFGIRLARFASITLKRFINFHYYPTIYLTAWPLRNQQSVKNDFSLPHKRNLKSSSQILWLLHPLCYCHCYIYVHYKKYPTTPILTHGISIKTHARSSYVF